MGQIHYTFKDGSWFLADDCQITEEDGVENLDCSVRLYNLFRRNGYSTIGQVTAQPGRTFFDMDGMSLRRLHELLEQLDFLGFRLADWGKDRPVEDYYRPYVDADRQRWEALIKSE